MATHHVTAAFDTATLGISTRGVTIMTDRYQCNVIDFGATATGYVDDGPAFQKALDAGCPLVIIPQGKYLIANTLRVRSNTTIQAHPNARIIFEGERPKKAHEYLLSNDDTQNGNENIAIRGGVWDGNNKGSGNQKGDLFDLTGYSGAVLNFFNVKNLTLENLIVANSITYFIRMAMVDTFTIQNVHFLSDVPAFNQDGIHMNGYVKNGVIRAISALSKGQTNDDLIAFNADDSMERVENVGMCRGPIENILVEDLFAEDCHTIIRILTVDAPIRNITIRNIYAGYRCYAINADAARYCRTPLFKDADHPNGVGLLQNIHVDSMTCFPTKENNRPAICLESIADDVTFTDFNLINPDNLPPVQAFLLRNVPGQTVLADGQAFTANAKSDQIQLDNFSNLTISKN